MEVISYLFSYKLQSPAKVFLIRGNHEIREVQKMFTFHKECLLKLGEKLGNEVWNAINNAFDTMPIAGIIDGRVRNQLRNVQISMLRLFFSFSVVMVACRHLGCVP